MSNLNVVEANLPPGFRFHPRDEELVCDYLMKKLTRSEQPPILMEVDLNKSEPWDIPDSACVGGKDWYFYSQRDRKYATGLRTNRATVSGYWKATGKDRPVSCRSTLVGMRKTLVFYQGRAPKGKKTDWVMHEFRLEGPLGPPKLSSSKDDWVLCRVFYKNKEVAAAKQGPSMGIGDDTSSSSTLPPLMDPYITFDQTHDQYEQVPCFSIFTPNQTTSSQSKHTQELQRNILTGSPAFGGINVGSSSTNNTLTCAYMNNPCSSSCEDTMVIDAVLNHLTKMDDSHINPTNMTTMMIKDSPCSFGEGSSESLSDVAFPTIWNHY